MSEQRKIHRPDNAPPVLKTLYDKAKYYMVEQYDGFWVEYTLLGQSHEDGEWYPQEALGSFEDPWEQTKKDGVFSGFPWDNE